MTLTKHSSQVVNLTALNSSNDKIIQDDNFTFETQTVIVASILILGILGNGSVCFTFYHYPSVRSLTNYVMVNLAFADLLLVTVLMLWFMMAALKETSRYAYNILVSIDVLCSSLSMLNLALVGIDRYIAVVFALRYATILTKKLVQKCLVVIWSFSLTVAVIAFSRHFVDRPHRILINQVFMTVWVLLVFVIPMWVIVFAYVKVFIAAWKQIVWAEKQMHVQSHRSKSIIIKKEIRLSLKLAIIVFPFCAMWGCYFGITLYEAFCICSVNVTNKGLFIIGILPHIVSVVNPIIYVIMKKDLRKALGKTILAPKKRLSLRRVGMVRTTTLQNLMGYLLHAGVHASPRPPCSEKNRCSETLEVDDVMRCDNLTCDEISNHPNMVNKTNLEVNDELINCPYIVRKANFGKDVKSSYCVTTKL